MPSLVLSAILASNLLCVSDDEAGQRIDRYLKRALPSAPHALVHKWLRSGQVRLNGARVKADARLSQGDTVRLPPQRQSEQSDKAYVRTPKDVHLSDEQAETLCRRILLENEDFFLLDKPAGLACQGGSGVACALDRTLLAVAQSRPSLGSPRLVHRLDRATSGLLLVAKSREAAADLAGLFKFGRVRKTYAAVLAGIPQKEQATYRSSLPDKNKGEQTATTQLFVLAKNCERDRALVLLRPLSGRKHQLRRHMAEAGTPVLGETLYATRSAARTKSSRLMLHALRLVIDKRGAEQEDRRYALDRHLPPPDDFFALCEALGLDTRRLKDARFDPFRLDPFASDPFV